MLFFSLFSLYCSLQYDGERSEDPLSVENTLWANTVVASGTALGVVVYTGSETRSVMNTSNPKTKVRPAFRTNKPVSQSCAERASRCFGGPQVP